MSLTPLVDQSVDHLVRRPRLVMLDRDGVINVDSDDYIKSVSEWRPIEGALDSIARLTANGFLVSVCTNQSGIARGYFSRETLDAIHAALRHSLAQRNSTLAAVDFCPHGPDDGCDCRKPQPGMLQQQLARLKVAAADALFVGDSLRDIEAAQAARVAAALVRTGNGSQTEKALTVQQSQAQPQDRKRKHSPDRGTVAVFDSLRELVVALLTLPRENGS